MDKVFSYANAPTTCQAKAMGSPFSVLFAGTTSTAQQPVKLWRWWSYMWNEFIAPPILRL